MPSSMLSLRAPRAGLKPCSTKRTSNGERRTSNAKRDTMAHGRVEVVQALEGSGVVAVIRMKERDKLRAVVDALAEGGVRALEVTMTVPRAIEMIGELAPALPPG